MMLPFPLQIQPGLPISEQLVYAVKKAVISGLLKPGSRFPSVRAVSQELRIHPNTAHKAVGVLIGEGLLEVHPGIGTVVGKIPPAPSARELKLFATEVERLVVEAKNRRLHLDELQAMVERQWNRLTKSPTQL
ncbi:MAG TPA: GntR family transcriptional regulator [Chthoniobacter sp.]|nr:GntR family transcriptional regulator [Chthoniobacter sp.]